MENPNAREKPMHKTTGRRAYLSLCFLAGLIVAGGGISGCSTQRAQDFGYVKGSPHKSFLYVELINVVEECSGSSCFEATYVNTGSGFAIAELGSGHTLAVTAGHVCETPPNHKTRSVKATALGGMTYDVQIISIYGETDTCFIAVIDSRITPLTIAKDDVKLGDKVYALGAPHGIFHGSMVAMFDGYYSGHANGIPHQQASIDGVLSLAGYTVPARPGSSGGPILNSGGEVVGMMVMAHPAFETFTLSPRQDELRAVLKSAVLAARHNKVKSHN
jgi:S1-C subfamily serine protease